MAKMAPGDVDEIEVADTAFNNIKVDCSGDLKDGLNAEGK